MRVKIEIYYLYEYISARPAHRGQYGLPTHSKINRPNLSAKNFCSKPKEFSMLTINKISSESAVDFAAEELKKYLRMMMPECGDIKIMYNPKARDGFRLGLMQDFGLDVSDAECAELDDILYIDTYGDGGIIAGDNPRSVLLSVYEYLRQNGCAWLFPGHDGEFIPTKDVSPVKYRHKPSCRYRGLCNEGAEFQRCMTDVIDFLPKVGMNIFMIEFKTPVAYYDWYYNHLYNEKNRPPEPISPKTVLQWKRMCECEMSRRGLQFHDIGHGFTIDPFGIDSNMAWYKVDEDKLPREAVKYMAEINGKRGFFRGQPINTNFCMSNEKARTRVVKYIADYAQNHSNIDYLHVWLADAANNHCECPECQKKTPSDFYMMLMNELDRELTERKLPTRIVFIVYLDTTWPPQKMSIENPERFSLLLAPISRSYTYTLDGKERALTPYVRNRLRLPRDLDEYIAYFNEWKKIWHGAALSYEYHFWRHMAYDPSGTVLAKRLIEDVKAYRENGVNGVIQDGSQRAFFPNGFAFFAYARALFDTSLTYGDIAKEYFLPAYGENWQKFLSYLEELGDAFDQKYLEGEGSANPEISAYYNPEYQKNLDTVSKILAKGEKLIKENYNSEYRVRTVAVRLLEDHLALCRYLREILYKKCVGDDAGAMAEFEKFTEEFGAREARIESYYDHFIFAAAYHRILRLHPTKKGDDVTL